MEFFKMMLAIFVAALTGKAQMKVAQMTAAEGRSPLGRKIDIFRDARWVEPLPIYAY
jgi:N-acyl homoserine lactone hydrolase